jgi:hypothetical protein
MLPPREVSTRTAAERQIRDAQSKKAEWKGRSLGLVGRMRRVRERQLSRSVL